MLRKALDPRAQMLVLAIVVAASLVHVVFSHYSQPNIANDSYSYILFSDMRPHGYPLYLKLHSMIVGSLRFLPQMHGLMFLASIAALAFAVALKIRSGLLAATAFLIAAYFMPGREFYGVMSDTFYGAALTFGIAFLFLHLQFRGATLLGLASLAFGIAAATRTIGMMPLALFFAIGLFSAFRSARPLWPGLIATVLLPALLALGVAAASNHRVHGEFRIGSWGGVSLLGKGLLLAEPLPQDHPLAELNWIAEHTNPAKETLFGTDHLWLRALMARQYYEYLRWNLMWEMFATRWPAWYEAEGVERSSLAQGKVAGTLAEAYVRRDLAGYASLVASDYASLWLVPRYFTAAERERLLARKAALEPLPYLTTFEATLEGSKDYFQTVPRAHHPLRVWIVRVVSVGFLSASVIWSVSTLVSRHRLPRLAANLEIVFIVLAVHGIYAATALAEAGLERYILPTWPALTMGLLLVAHDLLRRWREKPSVRGTLGAATKRLSARE